MPRAQAPDLESGVEVGESETGPASWQAPYPRTLQGSTPPALFFWGSFCFLLPGSHQGGCPWPRTSFPECPGLVWEPLVGRRSEGDGRKMFVDIGLSETGWSMERNVGPRKGF